MKLQIMAISRQEFRKVQFWVPQLFMLYINDVTDNLHNLARLFADDTSISYSGSNFETMKTDINNDIINLNEWETYGLSIIIQRRPRHW